MPLLDAIRSCFTNSKRQSIKSKPHRRRTSRRMVLESLENRQLFAADFGSAMIVGSSLIGSDLSASNARDVAVDSAGNTYVTGAVKGMADFDPCSVRADDSDILTPKGSWDTYVAKYAPDESLLWVRQMGSDSPSPAGVSIISETGNSIKVDNSGNVYVVGQYIGSAQFGATTLTAAAGDVNAYVMKLDTLGNVQWAKSWGTAVYDTAVSVDVDGAGNVYALGSHPNGSVTYDDRVDILKFNASGSLVWQKEIAARVSRPAGDLVVSDSGNVFITGSFSGTVDFDPGPKSKWVSGYGVSSSFVLKLNTNANFSWVSPFVGKTVGSTTGRVYNGSIALDISGNIFVGGSYMNTVDFDPGSGVTTLPTTNNASYRNLFASKLNASGALVWAKALDRAGTSGFYGANVSDIATDGAGNVYLTGTFEGKIDVNPGSIVDVRTASGLWDMYVLRLSPTGNFDWAETFGGEASVTWGYGIDVGSTGDVYVAGGLKGSIDFDPDPVDVFNLSTVASNGFRSNNAYRLRLKQV